MGAKHLNLVMENVQLQQYIKNVFFFSLVIFSQLIFFISPTSSSLALSLNTFVFIFFKRRGVLTIHRQRVRIASFPVEHSLP